MKRSYVGVLALCLVLLLNIVFLQLAVHQFFFERYTLVLIYVALNILLFPIALWIYKKEKNQTMNSG
ncbi:hypothetical protein HUG15_03470 [Salicibibacter cibarius]|uniref:Uncharacterized protein n=1 Tax=Salicibibacter cibarius TaxID=2743000 RepID=A0A7T6Z153_9BACI|nr:hypothetical protein [Salicibibacter cibarius]QQK74757.1 hypothetical protein HUG15_03470 [Salicibibacter cibarius]